MNGKQYIIEEGKDGNKLTQKNEKELIKQIYAYIVKYHSDSPQPSDFFEICKATLVLFKYLKVNPSSIDGIVCSYSNFNLREFAV